MLKVRIIPTMLWKNFGLVKGIGFDSWRRVGPVLPTVKVYNMRDVDELILVDITASLNDAELDIEAIRDFAAECSVPFTIGGGITNLNQIQQVLAAGADKVSLNTAAYSNPSLIKEAAEHFGSQCVVVSIDARTIEAGSHECYSHSGTVPTGRCPKEWAKIAAELGAGEILVTSIERDGSMQGYDLELIRSVTEVVNVPVIASGGAGSYEHMRQAVQEAGASAIAAASMFHFTEQTPVEAKKYLSTAGVPVRLPHA